MSVFDFVPDQPKLSVDQVPYIEDARRDIAPGYSSSKSEKRLQAEIVDLIVKLGGGGVSFSSGAFGSRPKRYGYIVEFSMVGASGNGINFRMHIAGLPMRTETAAKKDQVMRQALFAFRDYLQGELNAILFRPGHQPFMASMVLPNGLTLIEEMVERQMLPAGPAPMLEG